MEFINETAYQADALWGGGVDDTTLGVAVIAKRTYIVDNGHMTPTDEDPWPIHFKALETPYGTFPSEYHPYAKPRSDFLILGCARSREPVSSMKIDAIAGDFRYSFRVFGDRHWEKRHGRLTPSYPEPFTEMPLILENAYGGSVTQEWGELAWIHNPKGKGYYATEEQALGGPLPNIEIDEQLIESHTDQPTPFAPCIYPLDGGLRVAGMDPMQPDVGLRETGHLFLCWAHPNMMMTTELSKGDPIRVSGILESGLFAASVPSLDAEGYVQYGEETKPFDFRCDTVIVQGESQRITFRWRSAMTFPLSPREKRVVYLVNKQGVQVSP